MKKTLLLTLVSLLMLVAALALFTACFGSDTTTAATTTTGGDPTTTTAPVTTGTGTVTPPATTGGNTVTPPTTTGGSTVTPPTTTGGNTVTPPTTTVGSTVTPPAPEAEKVNVKFFKVGKANATLIRCGDIAILVDTGENDDEDNNGKADDGEKILEYLAEKGVWDLDMVIISQFNKNHYGALGTILEGIEVKEVYEPSYAKTGNAYDTYRAALTKAGITPKVISKNTALTAGELSLTVYPAASKFTGADQDEYYSLAVTVETEGFSLLIASDIFGARVTELITALNGKTFDILQVPKHGAFSNVGLEELYNAVKPKYAVIFASANNPADTRTVKFLMEKGLKAPVSAEDTSASLFITKDGSVEAKYKNGVLTVKQ